MPQLMGALLLILTAKTVAVLWHFQYNYFFLPLQPILVLSPPHFEPSASFCHAASKDTDRANIVGVLS